MQWAIDLDGVVWRGDAVVPGSPEAIASLRARGDRVVFVTNSSAFAAQGYIRKLSSMGIDADEHEVLHAGHAVALLIEPESRVLRCAGDGIAETLTSCDVINVADLTTTTTPEVDVVVVGWRADFDFGWFRHAAQAVLQGARLVAPSADPLYPVADGFHVGGGALASAISYATNVEVTTAGKPFPSMTEAVRARVGEVDIVVGDQARTDGRLAQQLGARFGLVTSGSPVIGDIDGVPIDLEDIDLLSVVKRVLG